MCPCNLSLRVHQVVYILQLPDCLTEQAGRGCVGTSLEDAVIRPFLSVQNIHVLTENMGFEQFSDLLEKRRLKLNYLLLFLQTIILESLFLNLSDNLVKNGLIA